MKIRCLIVDDEPLALRLIEKHLAKIEGFEVVATCSNALKAFEILGMQPVDLMFLDIKMPNMTGIEFLKNLKNPPQTILTTAYRDFAIESYDIGVVDYLLKPITFERFFKAINKFLESNSGRKHPTDVASDSFVILKSGLKSYKIDTGEVLYIESLKDYIKIYLANDNPIVLKYRMGDIELELKSRSFLRIHRSFIINTKKIVAFTHNEIEIKGVSAAIPVGASYKEEALLFFDTYSR